MFRVGAGGSDLDVDEAAIVQLTAWIDKTKRIVRTATLTAAASLFLCGVAWYQVGLVFFLAAVAMAPLGVLAQRIALRILVPRWIDELVSRGVRRTPLELAFMPH